MNWEGYAWTIWIVSFFVLEGIGLWKRGVNEGMTLTFFIENHVKPWILAPLLGWLVYHFLIAGRARG